MTEQNLNGGITNAGDVVRVGPHVLRPATPHTASVHAFLRAIRDAGFEGAPLPVGVDDDGRERLEFIEGDVPTVPYPGWSQSDTALASIARLLRAMHDAARDFEPSGLPWSDELADSSPGPGRLVVCHNDVELSNVVFRDGVATALIDFEFAAPGRPVYDLAQMARLCVPIEDDFDQARMGWEAPDGPARLRLIADTYGLDQDGRQELVGAMDDAIDRIEVVARRNAQLGGPSAAAALAQIGGIEKYDRRRAWWLHHKEGFAAALR